MTGRFRLLSSLLLAILLISLSSCDTRVLGNDDTLYTGDRLTPEMIDSLFEAISKEETERYPLETLEDGRIAVYWVNGGSVWHISELCSSLSGADPESVIKGNVDQAFREGKNRGCKVCAADYPLTPTDTSQEAGEGSFGSTDPANKYPKDYNERGELIVYWLDGGSVWHESAKCGTVTKADPAKLFMGSALEAYLAGKDRPCKVCSADSNVVIVPPVTTMPEETTEPPETTKVPETTEAPETAERYPKEYYPDGNVIVYWLDSGSVWHESAKCGTVTKADPAKLSVGSALEAYLAGKDRPCKVCSADSNVVIVPPETTEDTLPETDGEQTTEVQASSLVYWTENGAVWHLSLDCSSLSKTDPDMILSGDTDDAVGAGKERVCKICSN